MTTSNDTYPYANMNENICPVCGSEMARSKGDDPHDEQVKYCVCRNSECGCDAVFAS